MKNIESLLKKIGFKSSDITKLMGTDELDQAAIDAMAESFQATTREAIQNDPDFIDAIKAPLTAKERATIEGKIKKTFGLTSDEMKDKKMDEIMELAVNKIKSQHTGTADELQAKLQELARENKRLLEEVIPAKENEATGKIKSFKKDLKIREKLSSRKNADGTSSFLVDPSVFLPALNANLDRDFTIDLDDKDEFIIKTKDGLNPLSPDKTKVLTFDEILDSQLVSMNVMKQSNGKPVTPPSPNTMFTPDAGGTKFNLPGLERAKANETDMAKIRTFGN